MYKIYWVRRPHRDGKQRSVNMYNMDTLTGLFICHALNYNLWICFSLGKTRVKDFLEHTTKILFLWAFN